MDAILHYRVAVHTFPFRFCSCTLFICCYIHCYYIYCSTRCCCDTIVLIHCCCCCYCCCCYIVAPLRYVYAFRLRSVAFAVGCVYVVCLLLHVDYCCSITVRLLQILVTFRPLGAGGCSFCVCVRLFVYSIVVTLLLLLLFILYIVVVVVVTLYILLLHLHCCYCC